MKLELSIADDRELRAFIKDLIKGEVRSIARGEIRSILAEVTKEKLIPKTSEELNELVLGVIKDEVRKQLSVRSKYSSPSAIVKATREVIREMLDELWESKGPAKFV